MNYQQYHAKPKKVTSCHHKRVIDVLEHGRRNQSHRSIIFEKSSSGNHFQKVVWLMAGHGQSITPTFQSRETLWTSPEVHSDKT